MSLPQGKSLQDHFAPKGICFGCGPANTQGLQIKSFPQGDVVEAHFTPLKHHQAFPGMVNGGIIGALLDCHGNWTAAWHLYNKQQMKEFPCTVTAEFTIKLKRPTPVQSTLHLKAWVVESGTDRAVVEGELSAEGKVCALLKGTFVAVKEGHPAFHRWG